MRWNRFAIVAVLALALAPATAESQIIGVKAGVNVAGLRGLDDTLDSDNTSGLAAGVFLTSGANALAFQGELNYQKATFNVGSDDLDISYLQGAALVKLGLPLAAIRPSVQGGVGYGFQASCDYTGGECDAEIDPSNAWVGIFGVDLEILLGGLVLVGDARYELGFSEISSASSVFEDVKSKTWVLRAGIGFRL
jgi:hypothetical protein